MVRPADLVISLREVEKDDVKFVGGKAANLGEMIESHFPVPGGFAITASAYRLFIKQNSLDKKIAHLLGTINFHNPDSLAQVSRHIKRIVIASEIPQEVVNGIFDEYEKLGSNVFVAVRSSAIGEDSKDASFAGQNETFLDIQGEAHLAEKVREAWASLFDARSIFYRHEKHISQEKIAIALVVQKMVNSEASGITFTVDPITGDKNKIIVEAIYGLGEYIVGGKVTPDHYEVSKKGFDILSKQISDQQIMLAKNKGKDEEKKVVEGDKQKITDTDIVDIAKIATLIEKHYYFPQDIEWAKEDGKIYIVQTRPITTLGKKK